MQFTHGQFHKVLKISTQIHHYRVNHMEGPWVQNRELTTKSKGLMEMVRAHEHLLRLQIRHRHALPDLQHLGPLEMWHHHNTTYFLHCCSRGHRPRPNETSRDPMRRRRALTAIHHIALEPTEPSGCRQPLKLQISSGGEMVREGKRWSSLFGRAENMRGC
jgi:hypothetical protein